MTARKFNLSFLTVLLLITTIAIAQPPYNLSGYIIDKSSGLPLSGVLVKTNGLLNITTGADGYYNFTLIDGEHSIFAILQNYAINSTTVTINGGNITNANISLIPTVPQGNDAWHSAGNSLPLPYSASWIPATLAQKNAILYNDSNIWETKLTTAHDQYDDQMYRFNVMQPINEVQNLTVKWIGHGENKTGYDTYLYIWNYSDVSWELLDTKNLGVEGTLNDSIIINLNNYIDLYGFVYIAARAKHYDYAPLAPSGLSLVGDWEAPITCSWSPVTDLDGDSVQYYAEILESGNPTDSSGWINETSFTSFAWTGYYSCRVKTRDNFTYTESSASQSETIHYYYSLNTNYVELKVNNQIIGNGIFNLRSANTSSSSFITWNNYVFSDNRVYYGLNETDVNNLVNGSWSVWNNYSMNPAIRLADLLPNTTYYYRPLTWYLGTVNNSLKAKLISTSRPGVWANPAEYMVSPEGWTGSPQNFRIINISAAPLNTNGSYISGLSLEAVIYNSSNGEIGRINLSGNGTYTGNFILPDYYSEENGYVTVPNYSLAGEFSVLKWSCKNCHADGERYPSTFNNATVHPQHNDTRPSTGCESCHYSPFDEFGYHSTVSMKVSHAYKNTGSVCSQNCHPQNGGDGGIQHILIQSCTNSCHKPDPGLTCYECHNDVSNSTDASGTSVLSPIYGKDVHYLQKNCADCHGNLTSINPSPSCATCHPRPGSNLTTVPGSIDNRSHSNNQTVPCGLCHNREHDVKSLTTDTTTCKSCHTGITHNAGQQCTTCHGSDPHTILDGAGPGCLGCHNTSSSHILEDNGFVLYYIDGANYSSSMHARLNINNASGYGVNASCWACHGDGTQPTGHPSNFRQPYYCADCHLASGSIAGQYDAKIVTEHQHVDATDIQTNSTNARCENCHNNSMKAYSDNGSRSLTNLLAGNVSHFGANRTAGKLMEPAINSTNCVYCHLNNSNRVKWLNATNASDTVPSIHGNYNASTPSSECWRCHIDGAAANVTANTTLHSSIVNPGASEYCIECHGTNGGATRVNNITSADLGMHINLNTTEGQNVLNNSDCQVCHFGYPNGTGGSHSMNVSSQNTYYCEDCHGPSKNNTAVTAGKAATVKVLTVFYHGNWNGYWSNGRQITSPPLFKDCTMCHLAASRKDADNNRMKVYHNQTPFGTVGNPGWEGWTIGNAAKCNDCHQARNGKDKPFYAPGKDHYVSSSGDCTVNCHGPLFESRINITHRIKLLRAGTPAVQDISLNDNVSRGELLNITALGWDDYNMIEAGQYKVQNASGEVIGWTGMVAEDQFNSRAETVKASIGTTNLTAGNYTLYIRVMSSGPRADFSKKFYPLNGQWSNSYSRVFTVI